MTDTHDDLGFTWRLRKSGEVDIHHHGRLAATLRGRDADAFRTEAARGDAPALQQRMARLTGNYRRGNERLASAHARNRR